MGKFNGITFLVTEIKVNTVYNSWRFQGKEKGFPIYSLGEGLRPSAEGLRGESQRIKVEPVFNSG